ncbi:alpha/beta fold hydrolase [bacterium]|nr:MAG: alpha/beta fold hydrolase [bacterium]
MKKFIKTAAMMVNLLYNAQLTPTNQPQPTFSYAHHNEIAFGKEQAQELPHAFNAFANYRNNYLNKSLYFDTSFISQPKKVRAHHRKKKPDQKSVGKTMTLITPDHIPLGCTYFDRGSDTLMIIGEGFTNPREYMTPFVDMFDCDVVLFDFRGQGIKDFSLFKIGTWSLNLAENTFGMDSSLASLGQEEDIDVVTVVNHFKAQKHYTKVCGLGICYGAFIFLKTAAMYPGIFDRIILDGCWLSLPLIVEKLKHDPKMICSPQNGGWANQWPWKKKWASNSLQWLTENIWGLQLSDISIEPYLPMVKDTSLLFIYGKDDLMITRNEWETIWHSLNLETKAALITSNPHVRNHFKQKELYKMMSDLFVDLEFDDFKEHVLKTDKILSYHTDQLTQCFSMAGNVDKHSN